LRSLSETIANRPPQFTTKVGDMNSSSPVLPMASVEDRIRDEMKVEEPVSDANTMVEKNENEAENEAEHGILPADALAADDYPKGLQFLFILLALILSIFMVALDLVYLAPVFRQKPADPVQTIVATAIPKITDEFHSVSQIGWYGSAFFLTVASFTSPWGKLFKYFTLKWTYLAAVFVFELGSLICGMFVSRIDIKMDY
jgi:hypothetical protein